MATLNEKKTCSQRMENFQRFLWNPDTGQLMGRTLINWVWISLYYVAFYIVMTGVFSLAIYSLMKTINPYTPDYQDQLKSPGVTLRPDVYGEKGLEIIYNMSDPDSWDAYVKILQRFLSAYNETAQEANKNCTEEKYYIQKTFDAPNHTKHSCRFTQDMLGECSGLTDSTFGFPEGRPCLIIKMNRIINFRPGNGTAPRVNCTTLPTYTNPLVAVKLVNITANEEVAIVCRVIGTWITTDNPHDPYEGKVEVKVLIKN